MAGAVGRPQLARPNRGQLFVSVNGRPVDAPLDVPSLSEQSISAVEGNLTALLASAEATGAGPTFVQVAAPIIEEQYATSKRWLELVRGENKDHIVRRGLHDHEALEKEESPPMITPLYCESVRMLSLLAHILGKEKEADEYDRLAENIRKAHIENFHAPGTGVVASGIQSVQAFALFLNMLPAEERPAALAHLVEDITDKHNGHLTTGIFGTRYMLDVLSREGRAEVVNDMVNLRGFPGWAG